MFETSVRESAPYSSGRSVMSSYQGSSDAPIAAKPEAMGAPGKKKRRSKGPAALNLDSAEAATQHGMLMGFFLREVNRQSDNRDLMDLCHRCYDGEQWSDKDMVILQDRGQEPITLNVTATSIDWILGTELRSRVDYKVLARNAENSGQAERKTEFLKYLSDINRTAFHRSRAFADAIKGGIGWLEDGMQVDEDGEPVYSRYESWRNMFWDSASMEMDLSDARYVTRSKWVDADLARSWWPKRTKIIDLSTQQNTLFGAFDLALDDDVLDFAEREMSEHNAAMAEFDYSRPRVRIIETWYRKVVPDLMRIVGGQFSGEIYDPWSEGHAAEIASGEAEVIETTGTRMYCAIFTTAGLLHLSESPYRHNQFPFTPVWCYRRDKNNMPYGVVERIRSIQKDINWRASKSLHILSSNKILAEIGAIDDIDEFQEEAARADSILQYNKGYKVEWGVDRELAPAHMEYMSRMLMMVEQVGGVTNENLGRQTNATSGKAINARQEQGSLSTAIPFDNLRLAYQVSGEKQISLIEQYFTKAKQFRIQNRRGTPSWKKINDPTDVNSMIAFSKADFVISEDAWQASVRQAQAEQLLALAREMAPTAPQFVANFIDLIIDSLDIPNREELVARARALNGQRDPDSDELTPEEKLRQEEEAEAKKLEQRMKLAQIEDMEGSGQLKKAQAGKATADTALVEVNRSVQAVKAQLDALTAAMQAIAVRGAVPVADAILRESGFVSQSEKDDVAAVDAEAASLEEMAAEGAAMEEMAMQEQVAPPPGAMPPETTPQQPPQF